jgi:hypothetical protein
MIAAEGSKGATIIQEKDPFGGFVVLVHDFMKAHARDTSRNSILVLDMKLAQICIRLYKPSINVSTYICAVLLFT